MFDVDCEFDVGTALGRKSQFIRLQETATSMARELRDLECEFNDVADGAEAIEETVLRVIADSLREIENALDDYTYGSPRRAVR